MRSGKVRFGSSQHLFARAPQVSVSRSKFNRSHGLKTTFDSGYLVPILVDEMLPGDTFNLKMHAFARLFSPLKFPMMDNLYMETFFFFVPNRLVWDNWERFNGYQPNPGDSTEFTVPFVPIDGGSNTVQSIYDYMGIPATDPLVGYLKPQALPFRAYNLIWNEWFRDENLQDSVTVKTDDTYDPPETYNLLKRGKRHDYFTSCLPFPQKGPDVSVSLGSTAPIQGTNVDTYVYPADMSSSAGRMQYNPVVYPASGYAGFNAPIDASISGPPGPALRFSSQVGLEANLAGAAPITINALREAVQTQRLFERDARGGTRYTEVIKSHFGVVSPDARLQRPEYIGGGYSPVSISPVAQTAPSSSGSNALAQLAAYGVVAPQGHGFTYSATEHGIIIGLVAVRADLNYQQGLERFWSRQTRFDYFWPVLSHLGEQAVLRKEIYATGIPGENDDDFVFGYQERYAEYRYKPSQITGKMRSTASGSLDSWHLAQDFGSPPMLNDEFIQEDPPMSRVLAVPDEPDFAFDAEFSYHCTRPMSVYAVPGLMDHF